MDAPHNMVVDHIDGDGLNNQKANLRICTQSQNGMNRRKIGAYTSRFKGVSQNKGRKKWRAQIRDGQNVRCLGYFSTEEVAARAYDGAASKVFGEYARLNFPKRSDEDTGMFTGIRDNPDECESQVYSSSKFVRSGTSDALEAVNINP